MKRGGGRRYYRPEDVDLLRGIRFLLYEEGYTIRGVQRILREQGIRFVQFVWQEDAKQLQLRAAETEDEEGEADTPGRGIFGLLTAFSDKPEQDEADEGGDPPGAEEGPAFNPRPLRLASDPLPEITPRAVGRVDAAGALTRDDLRRLQSTLKDLHDCRQMLDAALKPDDV
jgi:DNA-binding transcriptional MerR regulator